MFLSNGSLMLIVLKQVQTKWKQNLPSPSTQKGGLEVRVVHDHTERWSRSQLKGQTATFIIPAGEKCYDGSTMSPIGWFGSLSTIDVIKNF